MAFDMNTGLAQSRRRFLTTSGLALVGTAALGGGLAGCSGLGTTSGAVNFTTAQFETLTQLSDMLIPATDTPGALAAGVPDFVQRMMGDWAMASTRDNIRAALTLLNENAKSAKGKNFIELSDADKAEVLTEYEGQCFSNYDAPSADGEDAMADPYAGYRELKKLVNRGYYWSEIGCTQEGSGMSGGYAAKELCERGFKVLVIERGRHVEHRGDEYTDMLEPWQRKNYELVPQELMQDQNWAEVGYALKPDNLDWFVRFEDAPYTVEEGTQMSWVRAHNTGGRSVLWSRQTYRMGPMDFEANAKDGNGVPWPIGYDDLKPWYDKVDQFVGIAGESAGVENVPDGVFQPAFGLTAPEKVLKEKLEASFPGRRLINGRCAHLTKPTPEQTELGRVVCQTRNLCNRGCSFGAYFSSLSASLSAAERTGNLTIINDRIVAELIYDANGEKVTGVRTVNTETKAGETYNARAVFLCASAFGSVQILLQSQSDAMPNGLGNTHDKVGRYITDHIVAGGAHATMPGLEDRYYEGRRPTGFYIPRFRNIAEPGDGYLRGGAYQSNSRIWSGSQALRPPASAMAHQPLRLW